MKNKTTKTLNILLPIISVACIIAVWGIVAFFVNDEFLLPTVGKTLTVFFGLFGYAEFYLALVGTLLRTLIAFTLSFILAFAFALISYKSQLAYKIISPVITIIRVLPTVAVVLLLLVWTNSNIAPVIVTMLVVLPTTYTSIYNALLSIDKKQLEMCKVFGVDEKTVVLKVKIPQILPSLVLIIGTTLSLNLKLMVAAEVLSFTANSIGHHLQLSQVYFNTATMMALVLVTVILGLIIEIVANLIHKKVGEWQ